VAKARDIVWLSFDPQAGHEQAGHRPALALFRTSLPRAEGHDDLLADNVEVQGFPFEIVESLYLQSVVLADQVRSLD
jgi:mRNA interferase MazF